MTKHITKPATRKLRVTASPKTSTAGTTRYAVGIDVGDRLSYICILDSEEAPCREDRVRTSAAGFSKYFEELPFSRIALEAGTHSGWVSRLLETLGHTVVVANARELRKIHQSDRKNDRADARVLARMVRFDPQLLAPIRHRSAQMQADLTMIRARDTLVGARTKCVNAARGLVKASGARLPKCSTRRFGTAVFEHVPIELHTALSPLIKTISNLSEQIRHYDRNIEALTKNYPSTELLRQVSGIGALTSLAFVLTVADPARFRRSRDIGPYLGLVPRQDDSGDRTSQLPITKAGDAHLRRLLVGSAQYILGPFGPSCSLRSFGERLAQRGGKNAKKRAVVAVARKLAILLHRLWVTGEVYEAQRNESTQRTDQAA
jgi:transposase